MGSVPALLKTRWATGELVGDAAHSCVVRIRQGFMNHLYQSPDMLDTTPGPVEQVFPVIWGGDNGAPWQGQWVPTGDWITLTNVQSANWVRSFTDKGGSTLTVVIDNIAFNEQTGAAGLYHSIDRGWFSPTRGVTVTSRPSLWAANEWADVFNGGYQVELWEGYGIGADVEPVLDDATDHWSAPAASKTWVGLIEDCESESHPDHITLTCRDYSVLLTDQRLMGQNKAREIQSPVTFAAAGSPGAEARGRVLVTDAADIVRMILLWAGFHEFQVQNFGWNIRAPMTWGQDAFFIDVIDDVLAQGNYVFFFDPPTDHDLSIGVPVFRPQSATAPPRSTMLQILDTRLSEALTIKWDMSNLPYVMRFRGAISGTGQTLFADLVKRFMGTYWPPWSGHDYTNLQGNNFSGNYPTGRVAGVRRQFSQTDPSLESVAECLFACILAAIQYALQAVTGTFQAPGLPGVGLDQQISVIDEGTGTNTRLWVASVESQHTLGPNGSWHMMVGGSVLDTEDMNLIAQDYFFTYQRYVLDRNG
jgi:hypothetical protein